MNPWERFQDQASATPQEGPWAKFAAPQVAPDEPQIDFNAPRSEIRKQIAALPKEQRDNALKQWADTVVAKERKDGGVGTYVSSVVRNIARGTPIGSWLDEANAGTNAMLNAAGLGGAPYDETLAYQRALNRADDASSTKLGALPVIGDVTVGGVQKLAGGIASAPFTPVARAFQGATFAPRAANYALTGAGYGAAYGAGEGEGQPQRTQNAMYGAAIGAGMGIGGAAIERAVGAGAQAVRDRMGRAIPPELQAYEPSAARRMFQTVQADEMTPRQLRFATVPNDTGGFTALGDQGMIADLGQNTSSLAGGIAKRQGEGAGIVTQAIRSRRRGAQGRINQSVNRTLGPAQDVVALREQAVRNSNQAAAPYYETFYQTPVQATPELRGVIRQVRQMREGRTALARAAELMRADGVQPSQQLGQYWDYIKRGIDDRLRGLKRGTNEYRILNNLRARLIGEVDNILSPGNPEASPWAVGRGLAGQGKQYDEGLDYGLTAIKNTVSPDQMRADMTRMPPTGQLGVREGMRQGIRNTMEQATTRFGQAPTGGIRQMIGTQAREKIAMAAPAGRTNTGVDVTSPAVQGGAGGARVMAPRSTAGDLARTVDAEAWFNRLYEKAVQGSQTNANQNANRLLPPQPGQSSASGWRGVSIPGLVAEGVTSIVNFVRNGALTERNERVVADLARMLVAQGAERRNIAEGLIAMAQRQQLTGARRAMLERIARNVMAGAQPQAVGNAVSEGP